MIIDRFDFDATRLRDLGKHPFRIMEHVSPGLGESGGDSGSGAGCRNEEASDSRTGVPWPWRRKTQSHRSPHLPEVGKTIERAL
jgi:hypothetical protein